MTFRTLERECLYRSSWDLKSVFGALEARQVDPERVGHIVARLYKWCAVPPERMAGALAIVFKLTKENE